MNPVGWFEIPVSDLDRAQKFYEAVLSCKLEQHEVSGMTMAWFPMELGTMGSPGSLVKHENYTPSHEGTVVYFSSADIDEALERVTEAGGKVLLPKKDIGEYGYIAHIEDTEGNRVALHRKKD